MVGGINFHEHHRYHFLLETAAGDPFFKKARTNRKKAGGGGGGGSAFAQNSESSFAIYLFVGTLTSTQQILNRWIDSCQVNLVQQQEGQKYNRTSFEIAYRRSAYVKSFPNPNNPPDNAMELLSTKRFLKKQFEPTISMFP